MKRYCFRLAVPTARRSDAQFDLRRLAPKSDGTEPLSPVHSKRKRQSVQLAQREACRRRSDGKRRAAPQSVNPPDCAVPGECSPQKTIPLGWRWHMRGVRLDEWVSFRSNCAIFGEQANQADSDSIEAEPTDHFSSRESIESGIAGLQKRDPHGAQCLGESVLPGGGQLLLFRGHAVISHVGSVARSALSLPRGLLVSARVHV